MEIWNPVDGSVQTIAALLPQEKINQQPLLAAKMISIENNTEVVFFGGKISNNYISEVWKYTYSNDSWQQLGNLLSPRCQNALIIVPGLKCP